MLQAAPLLSPRSHGLHGPWCWSCHCWGLVPGRSSRCSTAARRPRPWEAMGGHGRPWEMKRKTTLTTETTDTTEQHSFYQQSQQSIFAVLWSCYKLPSAILSFKLHPECSETPASPQTKTKTTNLNVCNTGEQREPLLTVFHSMQL